MGMLRRVCMLGMGVSALGMAAGCAVPQPRGQGLYQYVQEPTTRSWYHLYLPADYVKTNGVHPDGKQKLWPLVMTFHGMKPYDNALPQEREWEQEADIYGYIVCAPELRTSDSFMEYPLTKEHGYVLKDRESVIATMRHVFATTKADPKRVLSTSWSCGGYLAHYFVNRYPDMFACVATRLSNFSKDLLLDETVPRYKDRIPVAIFIGDGDFPACKRESEEAVAWYLSRGFRVVRGKMIDAMGHRRIPQTAAAFFAEHLGIAPLHPLEAARTVAQVQMTEYYPPRDLIARMSPRVPTSEPPISIASANSASNAVRSPTPAEPVRRTVAAVSYSNDSAGRNYPDDRSPSYDSRPSGGPIGTPAAAARPNPGASPPTGSGATRVARDADQRGNWLEPSRQPQPETSAKASPPPKSDPRNTRTAAADRTRREPPSAPRPTTASRGTKAEQPTAIPVAATSRPRPVNIRLSGPSIGTAPHYIAYEVDLPRSELQGADFLWMDNSAWIGDESRGVKILETPGLHKISVLVLTRNNQEYRGTATVQVLERGPSASAGLSSSR